MRAEIRRKNPSIVVGFRFRTWTATWLYYDFLPGLHAVLEQFRGVPGYLVSFLPTPVSQGNGTYIFSAALFGFESPRATMWTLGRMELLALQLVNEVRTTLDTRKDDEDNATRKLIENYMGALKTDVSLDIMIAPHKMLVTNDALESSAPGSGGRSDVFLIAWERKLAKGTCLMQCYHTTNSVPNTATRKRDQVYPETRLLVK